MIYLQQQRGLSLAQAALVDVTFFVTVLLSELPTGIVADRFGRKASLTLGAALMAVSMFGWTLAPTIPLIMLAYAGLAVGYTFLSGADEAFLYETLQRSGHTSDYQRLAGRAGATMVGALALGSVAGSLLAGINLMLPFLLGGAMLLAMLGVVRTFQEPAVGKLLDGLTRPSLRTVVQHAIAVVRKRPAVRFPVLYLALITVASVMVNALFLQPQALAFGVPIAAIGAVVLVMQIASIAGATWSRSISTRLGDERLLVAVPALITISLLLLATVPVVAVLLCIAAVSFVTAVVSPVVLNRIQHEVSDEIRATMLSVQSLFMSLFLAMAQPTLGAIADRSGLPAAYLVLAGAFCIVMVALFWSRRHAVQQVEAQAVP